MIKDSVIKSEKKNLKVCLINAFTQVPPYGALSLAAVLERNGIEVKVLDFSERGVDEKIILDGIGDSDIIGLSAWSQSMILEVIRITRLLREKVNERKFLIWGGVHPTLFSKEVIEEFDLDAVCIGEGEFTLLELVQMLKNGGDITKVKGLWVRKNGDIVFTGVREEIIDVANLPGYAWHLIDVNKYVKTFKLTLMRELTLVESRGCPYLCTFCYAPRMFGTKWRGRTVEQIIEEVKFLKEKYNIYRFDFLDDLPFGGSRDKMLDFCRRIKGLNVQWSCDQRINNVDEGLLCAMKDANIWYIYFGIESGSQRMLKKIRKVGVTPEKAIRVFDLCYKLGIVTMAGFIIGMPGETREDLEESAKLAKRLKATLIRVAGYVPYAGTELYEEALKMGFKPPVNAEGWGRLGSYARVSESLTEVPWEKLVQVRKKMEGYSYWKSIKYCIRHMQFNTLPYLILYTALDLNPDSKIVLAIKKMLRPLIGSYAKIYSLCR